MNVKNGSSFKPTKEMTAKEYREMERTKMKRHDAIDELIQRFEDNQVYIHDFPKEVIHIMNGPIDIIPAKK